MEISLKKFTNFMEERTAELLNNIPEEIERIKDCCAKIFPIKKITKVMEDFTEEALTLLVDAIHNKLDEWENTEVNWNFLSRKSLAYTAAFAVIISSLTVFSGINAYKSVNSAYAVSYDGRVVAYVRDAEVFDEIIDEKESELSDFYGYEKKLSKPFIYEPEVVEAKDLTSREDIRKFVSMATEGEGFGYKLYVGSEEIGILKSKEETEALKDKYIEMTTPENLRENAEIKEKVSIERSFCREKDFKSIKALAGELGENLKSVRYYITGEGESLPFIAKMEEVDYKLLKSLNPDVGNFPIAGTKLKLTKGPVFNVISNETKVIEEDLDFEVEYEKDSNLYDTRSYVKQEGVKGKVKAKDKFYYENNELIRVERLTSETLKEPVKKIVVKGAKATPKYIASGKFSYPARGRFTSGFGRRWGRMHKGIDLAGAYGSAIKAADGGTVVYVGNYYGLGRCIKIDHGNGYQTVYGHLSGYKVSRGDKVGKGETIGYMGNSGNSTGTHLHFEVHKNGTPVNPMGYLR